MDNWLKSWLGPLLLILAAGFCATWWILLFTEIKTVKLTVKRNNKADTTYVVAPVNTKYFIEKGDTTYVFFDKKRNIVLKVNSKEFKNIIISK